MINASLGTVVSTGQTGNDVWLKGFGYFYKQHRKGYKKKVVFLGGDEYSVKPKVCVGLSPGSHCIYKAENKNSSLLW